MRKRTRRAFLKVAGEPAFAAVRKELAAAFQHYLRRTGDPRILGTDDIFETYERYSPVREFPVSD